MSIRKEDAYQHALCMDLQVDSFRYAVISKDSGRIVHHKSISLETFEKDSIKSLLVDEELGYDYGSFVATAASKRNTLMPVDLFNHSKAEDIFKLNFPAPVDNLDYNRIPELGIVNIYELPLWIKTLFVIKFPRVKLVHPGTALLKGAFNQKTWSPKVHLHLTADSFYMIITSKSKLQYFNRFDYTNVADMVYHILFVLEQKEFDVSKMDVMLYGVDTKWELKDEFQGFFKNPVKLSPNREEGEAFILASQLLCV